MHSPGICSLPPLDWYNQIIFNDEFNDKDEECSKDNEESRKESKWINKNWEKN